MSDDSYIVMNIEHQYGPRTVLKIKSLTIRQGEFVTLVGPSGAGKSTLLRLLALLEVPTMGKVQLLIDGRTIKHETATIHDRRQIGMVFQQPLLLSRNVRDNVAYGLRLRGDQEPMAKVDSMLQRLNMLDMANAGAQTLSGGEKQRVALARTFVLQPRILLLDEPTANLDPANVELVEHLLREYHQQQRTTIVMVTHHIFQARRLASRVGLLLGGELIEIASTEQFFTAPDDPRTAAFTSGKFVY